jgi:hypothetical protein
MDTDGLIASLTGSLAWPIAAVILGLVFRHQLREIFAGLAKRMGQLTKVKAAGAELNFGDVLLEAKSDLQFVEVGTQLVSRLKDWSPENSESKKPVVLPKELWSTRLNRFLSASPETPVSDNSRIAAAKASPATTVLLSWISVEDAIRGLGNTVAIDEYSGDFRSRVSFISYAQRVLIKAGQLANFVTINSVYDSIKALSDIEQSVAKNRNDISALEAYDYSETANRTQVLLSALSQVIRDSERLGPDPLAHNE